MPCTDISSNAPSLGVLLIPMFAISALSELWCMLEAPDNGIFLFFLLLVFSKLSYPSADDAVDPEGGDLPDAREASTNLRCSESGLTAVPLAMGAGG